MSPMKKLFLILISVIFILQTSSAAEVLIVADEIPAMEVLAKALKDQENINTTIVLQTQMPQSIAHFQAVIVYIHQTLDAGSEKAFIKYANEGGKLICLHHTISSVKKNNEWWFSFLGIDLIKNDVNEGGYKWIEGVNMEIVNLAPKHFITTNKIEYNSLIAYTSEVEKNKNKQYPGFFLPDTEVYLNHVYLRPRTILLGFKYQDAAGKIWMQDRSAWCMKVGKGWLFYSQAGHTAEDFKNPIYARIIANAVIYKI